MTSFFTISSRNSISCVKKLQYVVRILNLSLVERREKLFQDTFDLFIRLELYNVYHETLKCPKPLILLTLLEYLNLDSLRFTNWRNLSFSNFERPMESLNGLFE